MRVVFLGTGGTYPCTERNVTSVAVQLGKDVLLLDCGEGTQRQFMRSTVSFMGTRWIFITHFHGDHFLGLPGLVQSMNLNGRERRLDIYGPEGTVATMEKILRAGHFAPGYEIVAHDLEAGDAVEFDGFKVSCCSAEHTVPTLAYSIIEDERPGRFNKARALELGIPEGPLFRKLQHGETIDIGGRRIEPREVLGPSRKGRKVSYTGDSRPSEEIIEFSRDADLLIHDATLLHSEGQVAATFGHSTALEAAEIALKAEVKMLALVHYSPRYKDVQPLVDEAKQVFPDVIAPKDLDEIVVKLRE